MLRSGPVHQPGLKSGKSHEHQRNFDAAAARPCQGGDHRARGGRIHPVFRGSRGKARAGAVAQHRGRSAVFRGRPRALCDRRLELPPSTDRRRDPEECRGCRRDDGAVPRAWRAGVVARRRHQPRRPVLQHRNRHRLVEIPEPHPDDRCRGTARLGRARRRPRRFAQRRRKTPSDLWPRPLDPRPQHLGRHGRQQFLRRPFGDGRAHRRQCLGIGRIDL